MLELSRFFTTFPVLETERLVLRAIVPEDAPEIFEMMRDVRVTQYVGRHPMTSMDEAIQRVERFQTTYAEQEGIAWAITPRGEQQLIGTCVLWNFIREHDRAEIGYVLSPAWWGKGVATEAASALLTFGFTEMGLHSVEAQIAPDNAASRRVLEKLGFVQEAYYRENYYHIVEQRFTDTAVFSLLVSTWMKRLGK